jgi:DNA polymerase III gamma/tau subunit
VFIAAQFQSMDARLLSTGLLINNFNNKKNLAKMKTLNQLSNEGVKYVVIRKNETEFWRDDIVKKAGQIHCIMIVDLTQPTHLCELAVSYPYDEIINRVQKWDLMDDDELNEIERDINFEGGYLKGNSTFEIITQYNDERTYEEVRENEDCNNNTQQTNKTFQL